MGDFCDVVNDVSAIVVAVGNSDKSVVVVVVPAAFVNNIDDIAVVLPVPSTLVVETSV